MIARPASAISFDLQTAPRHLVRSSRKNLRQRFCVSWILALLLLTLPITLSAQFVYTTNNGAITITGYNGPGGEVSVPSTLSDLPVTRIGPDAFARCYGVTSITLPNTVTNIGTYAFFYCTNLTSISLPSSLISINDLAFFSCFSLTNVHIPKSVTNLVYGPFNDCPSLRTFTVDPLNPRYSSRDGVLFNRDQTTLVAYPEAKGTSYTIPDSVTTIGEMAFGYCHSLTDVSIPNTVTNIESGAFSACPSLRNLALPSSLITIGPSAFCFCSSLTEIVVPAGVLKIGEVAFAACNRLLAIRVDVNNSSYASVDGVLFNRNRTMLVQCPAGKTGSYAIPAGVTSLEAGAFSYCLLSDVTMPDSLTSIPYGAFQYCALRSVVIPNTVTNIGHSAFSYCGVMTNVTMGSNVTYVGEFAFLLCSNLKGVYFTGDAPKLGRDAFYRADKATVYYLPGTTGWDATFGGRPTALWLPKVVFADSNLESAVRDNLNKPTGDLTSADLSQLTTLNATSYGIKTLSGLEAATNLLVLNVAQNGLTNAAALASLPQLTSLDLSWNYLRDLSPLAGLTNLTYVCLVGNSLETLPPLAQMTRLTRLILFQNHISDLAPLQSLTNLWYLDLSENPIASAAALCGLTNLSRLSLGGISMTNADSLACMTHLSTLTLRGRISDLTPLLSLTNLLGLDLSGNPVRDWTPLAQLTNLTDLSLCGSSLTNVEWMAAMSRLDSLQLAENSISDLSPLAGLTNLSYLDLSHNPLTNYMPLAALPRLETLSLQGNSITDLSFAAKLPQLQSLDLRFNRLAELTPLAGSTNLLWLGASYNVLTNISALGGLAKLQGVSLEENLLDLTPGSQAMNIIQTLQSNAMWVSFQPQIAPPQIRIQPQWLLAGGQRSWLTFLLEDEPSLWVPQASMGAQVSDPGLIPELPLITSDSDAYGYSRPCSLGVTPVKDRTGTATITLGATNYAGLWTTVTIQIQVVPLTPFDAAFVDAPGLTWSSGGTPAWFGQNAISHDGVGAAQSGGSNSWLQTQVTGPGTLRFWYKLESDDYTPHAQLSASAQDSMLHAYEHLPWRDGIWQQATMSLGAGSWVLKWSPSWDEWNYYGGYGGVNTLWVDQVSFVPGPPACWLELDAYEYSSGGREVHLHGTPGQTYEVQGSSDLHHWSPLTQVTCENFESSFWISRWDALARFYRARALP